MWSRLNKKYRTVFKFIITSLDQSVHFPKNKSTFLCLNLELDIKCVYKKRIEIDLEAYLQAQAL